MFLIIISSRYCRGFKFTVAFQVVPGPVFDVPVKTRPSHGAATTADYDSILQLKLEQRANPPASGRGRYWYLPGRTYTQKYNSR